MAFSMDVYRELEDIVAPENISADPAILDGYAFQPMVGAFLGMRYFDRPEAVVLPGSAEEIQGIMKLCNRRGVQAKAFCTGYGAHCAAMAPNMIILDLRRMNRILDLDEKNMTVVVEPYVSFAQVQAEANKSGLGIHIIGAGSQCSVLASHTSMHGNNSLAISHGYSGRNLLGVEWVMPDGGIVRLGTPGSGAGWFSGDGPGPSLRGIIRGAAGAQGGLGVFTKCAVHLHPWYGPEELSVKGVSPYMEAEIPPLHEYHICEFPSWEKMGEAMAKIGEAGIAHAMHKTGGPGSHGACVTGSNNEYYEKRENGELAIPWISFSLVMAANSEGERAYQARTLNRILEETDGKISEVENEPHFKARDYLTMVRACFIPRLAFRCTGTFFVDGVVAMDSVDHMVEALKWDEGHRNRWAEKKVIMDDGTINNWAVTFEGSHFALAECGHPFSSIDEFSFKGMQEMVVEGEDQCMKAPYAWTWTANGPAVYETVGPASCNYHTWMRKIKKTFDPNNVGDEKRYIAAED
jgi:glycolate oxidase